MIRRGIIRLGLALFTATTCSQAQQPARIAIVSDGPDADFAALVTTELSSRKDLVLLERDELSRIGDEKKLQELASINAIALGKLADANGLLFIHRIPEGIEVRLTAVGLGYAVFDDVLPSEADPSQQAHSLAHRITDYAPKLMLDPAHTVRLSVLNLRADENSDRAAKVERDLTLLLESRLAAVPNIVLLERRHAWSLHFERSLDPATRPLLQGAFLAEGSLDFGANDGSSLTVRLQLQVPGGQVSTAQVEGSTADLVGLADRLGGKINFLVGNTSSKEDWSRNTEAQAYLDEANWAYHHSTDQQTLEALDAAELLAGDSAPIRALRLDTLCKRAGYGIELAEGQSPGKPAADSESLDQRTRDLLEALELARQGAPFDSVVATTSKVLVLLDEAHDPKADTVRESLQTITHFDPLHGSLGIGDQLEILYYTEIYADEWSQSLDEELACYRILCQRAGWLPPVLLCYGKDFCPRFLNTESEQRQAFGKFLTSLATDPKARLSFLLMQSASPDHAVADPAFSAYVTELWNRRAELTQKGMHPEWNNGRILSPGANNWRPIEKELFTRHAREMIPLLLYYLDHYRGPDVEFALEFLWQPAGWTPQDAAQIWPVYLRYRERLATAWKAENNNLAALPVELSKFEDPFTTRFPEIVRASGTDPDSTALVVNRLWTLPESTRASSPISYSTWNAVDDGFWVLTMDQEGVGTICHVHLPSLKVDEVPFPAHIFPQTLRATPDAIYLDYFERGSSSRGLARYELGSARWTLRPITVPFMTYYTVGNAIYLNLRQVDMVRGGEAGIARYDWDKDSVTILSSTRRRPPQNQFDNHGGSDILAADVQNVFAGPDGGICVDNASGVFHARETPGNWQPVFDAHSGTGSVTQNGGTLVGANDGEVVFLSPRSHEPLYLMAPSTPDFRHSGDVPARQTAPWLKATRWNVPENPQFSADGYDHDNIGFADGRLFILVAPIVATGNYELLVFSKDHGRDPVRIPLRFRLPSDSALNQRMDRAQLANIEQPNRPFYALDLMTLQQGLCFHMFFGGVWFLPYSNLDQYLRHSGG